MRAEKLSAGNLGAFTKALGVKRVKYLKKWALTISGARSVDMLDLEKTMSNFPEYPKYDGLGLAELVRSKQVSPEELVEEAIARIEAHNPNSTSRRGMPLKGICRRDLFGGCLFCSKT